MTINLTKGQGLSLAKNTGLSRVFMGLGWDAAQTKGWFGKVKSGGDIDLDASVIAYDANGSVVDSVWFGSLRGMGGAVQHSGDNRTGDGDGDDETIHIDLAALPANIQTLVFTVNSYRGQTFDAVDNATCRLVDASNNAELCQFRLAEKGSHTGLIMTSLSRKKGFWEVTAIGEPVGGTSVRDLYTPASRYA